MPSTTTPSFLRGLAASCLLSLCTLVQAGPLSNFFFEGSGNVVVFDAAAGTGGWVGQANEFIDPMAPPPASAPLSLVSLVTFQFDTVTGLLSGQFEFTQSDDLNSSFYGSLMGSFTDPLASLDLGGTLSLNYSIEGGQGAFFGANGFGLSLLSFDPNSAAFDNYTEQGLISATVPEPASLALALTALGLLTSLRRRLR